MSVRAATGPCSFSSLVFQIGRRKQNINPFAQRPEAEIKPGLTSFLPSCHHFTVTVSASKVCTQEKNRSNCCFLGRTMEKVINQRLKFLKFNSDAPSPAIEKLAQTLASYSWEKHKICQCPCKISLWYLLYQWVKTQPSAHEGSSKFSQEVSKSSCFEENANTPEMSSSNLAKQPQDYEGAEAGASCSIFLTAPTELGDQMLQEPCLSKNLLPWPVNHPVLVYYWICRFRVHISVCACLHTCACLRVSPWILHIFLL